MAQTTANLSVEWAMVHLRVGDTGAGVELWAGVLMQCPGRYHTAREGGHARQAVEIGGGGGQDAPWAQVIQHTALPIPSPARYPPPASLPP